MDKGQLVPDEVVIGMSALDNNPAAKGFCLMDFHAHLHRQKRWINYWNLKTSIAAMLALEVSRRISKAPAKTG